MQHFSSNSLLNDLQCHLYRIYNKDPERARTLSWKVRPVPLFPFPSLLTQALFIVPVSAYVLPAPHGLGPFSLPRSTRTRQSERFRTVVNASVYI